LLTSDWSAFEAAGRLLLVQDWIFAKTMPKNPHEYTLRRKWQEDNDFITVARYIREHGYRAYYWGKPYMQLDVNEHFYWTMGAPISETILINRKVKRASAKYDEIAPVYDSLFLDTESLIENASIVELLGDVGGKTILDIGCGTGLLLDYVLPRAYTGIDPSSAMLERLKEKHPERGAAVIHTELQAFVGGRYDLIVALFGAASYLNQDELARIPALLNDGGRFFLMFYKNGYRPVTYAKSGIICDFKCHANLPLGEERDFHNFTIVEGAR
jgi:SAM-dependent methyltransferase